MPTEGVPLSFEELYANQSKEHASFAVRYVSGDVRRIGSITGNVTSLATLVGIGGVLGHVIADD